MGLEDTAIAIIGQHATADKKLHRWLKEISNDKDFKTDFKEWMVDPDSSKYNQRVDLALYQLGSHIVWFRWEERMSEKRLGLAVAEFCHKIKTAGVKRQQRTYFVNKRIREWKQSRR